MKDKIKEFNSHTTRDAINQKLLAKKLSDSVVATIDKSRSRERVIITIIPKYKNNVLLKYKAEWELIVDTVNMQKDANWVKIIAYDIDITIFSGDNGMKLLKSEIEIFNREITLALNPMWLTKEENRVLKKHSSIILTVNYPNEAKIAINQGLYIVGNYVTVTEWSNNKPTDQCSKCQKFGHWTRKCTDKPNCQYCGVGHATRDHKCYVYKVVKRLYDHTVAKCVNYQGSH